MRDRADVEGDSGSHSSVFALIMFSDQTMPAQWKLANLFIGLPHDISASLSNEGQPVTLQWLEIIHQFKAALTWNPNLQGLLADIVE